MNDDALRRSSRRRRNRRRRRQNRANKHSTRSNVLLVISILVFAFAAIMLIRTIVPYISGAREYDALKASTETDDGFSVDWDALLKENPDTVGWIRFDEPSVISYPVVKSHDNEEYLTKTFSANDNKLGAIFMDMKNSSSFTDRNTIIYGHHLNVGGEMFSRLEEYADKDFYEEHPYFYIYTPDGKKRTYEVFTAGVVSSTADQYQTTFLSDSDFGEWLAMCGNASNYDTGVSVNTDSQIVSLSTCTNANDDERFMLQGVMIKEELVQ